MTKYFIILMIVLASALSAQFDERQILSQQASQLLTQRQYNEAEAIFLQILDKYPDDLNSFLQLMQIYLSLSLAEKAESLLVKHQRSIPQSVFTEQKIQVQILQGKLDLAIQNALSYIQQGNFDANRYRLVASYFERRSFFEQALTIYQYARAAQGKQDLFNLEIANAFMQLRQFRAALVEYLTSLSSSTTVNFFVRSQVIAIVKEDSTLVPYIRDYASASNSPIIKELFATALVELKDYKGAMEAFKQISPTYLVDFSKEQVKLGNWDIALPAYQYLIDSSTNPIQILSYRFEIAKILYMSSQLDSSIVVIESIINDSYWKQNPQNTKNKLNIEARRLLSEIAVAMDGDIASSIRWLQEAKKFSSQAYDTQDIDLEIARLLILCKDFPEANSILRRVSITQHLERRDYLNFLQAFMQNDIAYADSLMNEFVIRYPGGDYTNDAIYLMMLSLSMDQEDQRKFVDSIALLHLHRSAGVDSLVSIFVHNQDEELLILAIEWAIGMGAYDKAILLLEHPFTDPLAMDYSQLLKLALLNDDNDRQVLAREFLKTTPNSVFSPNFRQTINRMSSPKPSL